MEIQRGRVAHLRPHGMEVEELPPGLCFQALLSALTCFSWAVAPSGLSASTSLLQRGPQPDDQQAIQIPAQTPEEACLQRQSEALSLRLAFEVLPGQGPPSSSSLLVLLAFLAHSHL